MKRKIIRIDEEKCDGCGLCADACVEGAIKIIGGKARLVNEAYCDGLGACVGECPRGAIIIEEREAPPFTPPEHAESDVGQGYSRPGPEGTEGPGNMTHTVCPGSEPLSLDELEERREAQGEGLSNWPIQLRLVPPGAPYLRGARLVVAADCTAFAIPGFHRKILQDRVLIIACPKLDDTTGYVEKLADIIKSGEIEEVTAVIMEVPCCSGLIRLLKQAAEAAGNGARLRYMVVSRRGEVLEEGEIPA